MINALKYLILDHLSRFRFVRGDVVISNQRGDEVEYIVLKVDVRTVDVRTMAINSSTANYITFRGCPIENFSLVEPLIERVNYFGK